MAFDPDSFIDFRINTRTTFDFTGGPEFNTLEIPLRSGITRRQPLLSMPKHRYRTNYFTLNDDERQEMLDAIWAAEGKAYSFRFLDRNDYTVENQALGVGDGTSDPIQLVKDYTFGPRTKRRDITLPYDVEITADGIPFTSFEVDPLSGLATPDTEWPLGEVLQMSCKFDVCVRFASDYNPLSAAAHQVRELMIELIEERYG